MNDAVRSTPVKTPPKARVREITASDIPDAVDVIERGFKSAYTRRFWLDVFACLSQRTVPEGFPRYGYVLESNGKLVGIILFIYSTIWKDGSSFIRCNGSTVCTDPDFRFYGPILYSRPHINNKITITNVTPSKHTYQMVEVLGYTKYASGAFLSIPTLSSARDATVARVVNAASKLDVPFDPHDRDLLLEHEGWGCISLWCVTPQRAYPFVFRARVLKRILPYAQLIYCANIDSFTRFARPLGAHLAMKLLPFVLINANGPIDGLIGLYIPGRTPMYYRGPNEPALGDLAYTETAMFGL